MNSPGYESADINSNHVAIDSGQDAADTGSPATQSRKRKAPGASGRGVASLTPEQLAKKRANDREAQRAIRERTRTQIENLERTIQELTSQQPYQDLQAIIRQKDALQAENEEVKRRLASVVNILQPLLSPHGLPELAQAAPHNAPPAAVVYRPEPYISATALPPRSVPPSAESGTYPSPFPSTDQDGSEAQQWVNQRTALMNQRESMQRNHELSENGERLNFSFLIDSANSVKNMFVPHVPERRTSPHERSQYPSFPEPTSSPQSPWNMLPKNCPPTCPLDSILINFLQARQRENANYSSTAGQSSTYNSPAYPSIANLLNPAKSSNSNNTSPPNLPRHMASPASSRSAQGDPISTLMTDIISKFPLISSLPEQVAVTYTMFLLMRWQIYPTQENYDRLPEWLTPRPSQLFTPHPAWIDHVPWPKTRDKVVRSYHDYLFEHWFLPWTSGLSVNWPYEQVDCLICTSEHEDPIINPVFERHIRRLENWSVGPAFVQAYPDLLDTVTVREPGNNRRQDIQMSLDGNQMPQGLSAIGIGLVNSGQTANGSESGGT